MKKDSTLTVIGIIMVLISIGIIISASDSYKKEVNRKDFCSENGYEGSKDVSSLLESPEYHCYRTVDGFIEYSEEIK